MYNEYYYEEIWKDIDNNIINGIMPNLYRISTFGNIYSLKIQKYLKLTLDPDGYLCIGLYLDNGQQKNLRVNRLVLLAFNPIENPELYIAHHKDEVRTNNHLYNLEWITNYENIQIRNMNRFGNLGNNSGILNPMAKLNLEQIKYVCINLLNKVPINTIADNVGVDKDIIISIVNGRTYIEFYEQYNLESVKSYYNEYSRMHRLNPITSEVELIGFTDLQINQICEFFQNNPRCNYKSDIDLYRDCCSYLNIEYSEKIRGRMKLIFKRKRHTNISNNYNY